eukprot:EG_transcript_7437
MASSALLVTLFFFALCPQLHPTEVGWVTFVVVSQGDHASLERTLSSLRNQTDRRWRSLVLSASPTFPSPPSGDPQFSFHYMPHFPAPHCIGFAFSMALSLVNTTWVAFLKEGDVVAAQYLTSLLAEVQSGLVDVFIARTYDALRWPRISPALGNATVFLRDVTYGFALRVGTSAGLLESYDVLNYFCRTSLRCIVSAPVLYFVGGEEVPLPLGERFVVPNSSSPELRDVSTCNALAARVPCGLRRGKPLRPKDWSFVLREDRSAYFASNVRVLRKRLQHAVHAGCMGSNHPPPVTTVAFEHKTKPKGKLVQLQMEQHTSHHFTPAYLAKLQSAAQVWETTAGSAVRLAARMPSLGQQLFAMPTYLYTEVENPELQCPLASAGPLTGLAIRYLDGCYFHWYYSNHTHQKLLEVRPSSSRPNRSCNTSTPAHPEMEADVLFYGAMEHSFDNQREKLCDDFDAAGIRILCLGALGPVLRRHVCRVKVVVVEHFYAAAATELHRIDALLAAGHLVVSVPPGLEDDMQAYRGLLSFTERSELAQTVTELLGRWQRKPHNRSITAKGFLQLTADFRPLCHAMCVYAGGKRVRDKQKRPNSH